MRIVIVGGGAAGTMAAGLLGDDGHDVVVLERDDAPPPDPPEAAWNDWLRRGVSQFHQPHGFLGRFRSLVETELPDLWSDLRRLDPPELDWADFRSPAIVDAPTLPSDGRFVGSFIRRPVLQVLLDHAACRRDRVDVRRGEAATDLDIDSDNRVRAVITTGGDRIEAELVIDAAGRRTPTGGWLTRAGIPFTDWREDDGMAYHSRWFRTRDGTAIRSGSRGVLCGLSSTLFGLLFPADDGHFALAMVGPAADRSLRRLREEETFSAVANLLPDAASWLDPSVSQPVSKVLPMASIPNRRFRLAVDGDVTVTGLVILGDAAASTNPSLGRGVGLALLHSVALRDCLREGADVREVCVRFDEETERTVGAWLADAVESDRFTREAMEHALGVGPPPSRGPRQAMVAAASADMECWRAWNEVAHLFAPPQRVFEDSDLMARAREYAPAAAPPTVDFSRDQLLALLD